MPTAVDNSSDRPPQSFPEGTPTGDLAARRGEISYMLGEINSSMRHLAETVTEQKGELKDFRKGTEDSIKDIKSSLRVIEDKFLVADIQVKSAYLTSKWLFGGLAALGGAVVTHLPWIIRFFGYH